MTDAARKTGPDAMLLVAIEQAFTARQRILTDDLAYPILPFGPRVWARLMRPLKDWIVSKTEERVPGLWGGIMARKRFIDDAVASGPTEAVVNLGAGFDTRAFRLPALAEVPVWEIDLERNIDPKRARLRRIFGEVPAHVTLAAVDFDREDLGTALASYGYAADVRTFFIWEGVTQYLAEPGVRATFDLLAKAVGGSRLVFTYIRKDFLTGEVSYGQEYLYEKMRKTDEVWLYGIDPDNVGKLLAEHGWRVVEELGYDELGERYVKPTGRGLAWIAIERIVLAEKS
jgi:methyltransferase (TIGR00027 family)